MDAGFNGHDWQEELLQRMAAAAPAPAAPEAYGEISAMLADLGDPYTRIVPPEWVQGARGFQAGVLGFKASLGLRVRGGGVGVQN